MTYLEYIHSGKPEQEAADAKAHYEKRMSRRMSFEEFTAKYLKPAPAKEKK